jgi:hypothetical protein
MKNDSLRLAGDTAKRNVAAAGYFKTGLTTETLKSGRIMGITSYDLEDAALKDVFQRSL